MEENKNVEEVYGRVKKKFKTTRGLFNFLNRLDENDDKMYDIRDLVEDYDKVNEWTLMSYIVSHQEEANPNLVQFDGVVCNLKYFSNECAIPLVKLSVVNKVFDEISYRLSTLYVGYAINLDLYCEYLSKDWKYKVTKEDVLSMVCDYNASNSIDRAYFIRVLELPEMTLFYAVKNVDDEIGMDLTDYIQTHRFVMSGI